MKVLRWIRNNIDLKVWSVVIAFLLWFHVATERTYDVTYSANLEFINPPKGWTIVGKPPEEISLRLRGRGKQLIFHRIFGEPAATVELPKTRSRRVSLDLKADDIILSRKGELEIVSVVSPTQFQVEMDILTKKDVHIDAAVEGEIRRGYVQVGKITVTPSMVELTGGRSRIAKIARLRTEPINLNGESRSVDRMVAVSLPQEAGYRAKPDSVQVTLLIERKVQKILERLPVAVANLSSRRTAHISPDHVEVALEGPETMIDSLNSSNVRVSLDLSGKGKGSHLIPPMITMPDHFEVVSVKPELIQTDIK